MEDFCN